MTGLLIGLGQPHRGDDGVGSGRCDAPPSGARKRLGDSRGPATAVLQPHRHLGGARSLVVVDAMQSRLDPPGTACGSSTSRRDRCPDDGWSTGGTHALGPRRRRAVTRLGRCAAAGR